MKVSVSVLCDTVEEANKIVAAAFAAGKKCKTKPVDEEVEDVEDEDDDLAEPEVDDEIDADDDDEVPAAKSKKKVAAKGKKKTAPVEDDGMEAEEETEDDELEDDGPTFAQVVAKFQGYAKKNGRPAAIEILRKKFKVKSVKDLDEKTYPKVMAALK